MSGRRIDDHSSWMGARGKDTVFPAGPHKVKNESSAMGAGMVSEYEDTTEAIKKVQEHGESKVKSNKMKPGYRY